MSRWMDKMRERREAREEAASDKAKAERKAEEERQRRRKKEDMDRFVKQQLELQKLEAKKKVLAEEQERINRENSK